jgi:protein TonB
MPVYPAKALKERVRGLVIVQVLVQEDGGVREVRIERGARADLNEAALEAARHWRFEPARKDGRFVRTYATIRFPFEGVQFARTPFPAP